MQIISDQISHQSDRDLPRAKFFGNVTKMAHFTAQEIVGLSLVSIIALPGCFKYVDDSTHYELVVKFSNLLWRGISLYYNLQQHRFKKDDLVDLDIKVRCYIKCFVDVCGYQCDLLSPTVGTKLCKLHSLLHITDNMRLFGFLLIIFFVDIWNRF